MANYRKNIFKNKILGIHKVQNANNVKVKFILSIEIEK
jgi:hypothetical protein